jgi:hypothetical protein
MKVTGFSVALMMYGTAKNDMLDEEDDAFFVAFFACKALFNDDLAADMATS